MTEAAERVKGELMALSPEDREELIHFLLNDNQPIDPDVEAGWDAELARRAAEIEGGKVVGMPADQVFADLRKKYS